MSNLIKLLALLMFSLSAFSAEQIQVEQETSVILQELSQYWQQFLQSIPMLCIGLVLLFLFYMIARPVSEMLVRPIKYLSSSELIRVVVRRIISLLIILLGFYIFLRFAGLSEFAVAVLSGTGVAGLIIGFAFKDIAENFISSLLLSIQKPFKLGDVIEVEGRLGVVKQVTARATTLVDFDGDHIQIPNSTVYKNIIRNLTANPFSRGKFVIGVGYDSSIIEAQKLALAVLKETQAVLVDPEPQVLVDILASSTVNLKVYFWINSHQHSLLKVSSYLMRTIMREFEKAGISMPDDARELIFPEGIKIHTSTDQNHETASANKSLSDDSSSKSLANVVSNDNNIANHDNAKSDHEEDLSSDDGDIRQQAKQTRDTESGPNIL
jgi:small-conductance mechanosensitive channel